MRFAAALALFASSAFAFQVISPSTGDKWSYSSAGTLSWEAVSTDPANFQVVLVNADFSVKQVLMASVDKNLGTVSLPPPSGGFPLGDDFRINLLSTQTGSSAILAQSGEFEIISGSVSTSGTGILPTTMSQATVAAAAATAKSASVGISTTATADDVLNPTGTSSDKNSAASSFSGVTLTGALFGTMSALVAFLL